jgi:hypothetical protein
MTHGLPVATVAPLRLIVTGAVDINVPPQALVELLVTVRPVGKVSLKPTPVSDADEFELVMVKLSVVEPFSGMLDAPNAFEMVGGATTVIEALAVVPVPPLAELTVPVVFVNAPAAEPVTVT